MNRRPSTPRVSEKAEQAHICQLLASLRWKVYAMGTHRRQGDYQGTMQTPGIPDLMAVPLDAGRRLLLFVECKAAGGRLRPEQREFRELVIAGGFTEVHHVVGGQDDVIAWLLEQGLAKASQFPHYRLPTNRVQL